MHKPAMHESTSNQDSPLARAVREGKVLTRRYRACFIGDWPTMALLFAQAPLIGWLCAVVWGGIERDTPSLHFIMALSAVWFGCMNACREIVKERAIFERERLFGVSLPAYVGSKMVVLAVFGLAQTLALQMAVEWTLAIRGPFLAHTFSLWGASVCGTALGLVVSAIATRQERAVGVVPLLLLPQILFSDFVLPEQYFTDVVSALRYLMPVHWSYQVFEQGAALETDWLWLVTAIVVLFVYALILCIAATAALIPKREI
jgi:ABC transport system ATP-binding/permease protein